MKAIHFSILVSGLILSSGVWASPENNIVVCSETRFADLAKIEIQETDLKGQYQMIETLNVHGPQSDTVKYSPVFSMKEIEKSEFPPLTSWNGYERKLVRYGRDHYTIEYRDESSVGMVSIRCKETF